MSSYRWRLYNPDTAIELTLPVNPTAGALPVREKTITQMPLTDPNAQPIMFEGTGTSVPTFDFDGFIISEAHYRFMVAWMEVTRPLRITDDLGNVFWGVLTKFTPKRRNRTNNKWSATYSCSLLITNMGTL